MRLVDFLAMPAEPGQKLMPYPVKAAKDSHFRAGTENFFFTN
jgi:hypothetical protein